MKQKLLFILRYLLAFIAPTVYIVIKYELYKKGTALYVVGIVTAVVFAIIALEYLWNGHTNSIPGKYRYIPGMLRTPLLLILFGITVVFARNYGNMLLTVCISYSIGVFASIPFTIAYNHVAWENYVKLLGGASK